MASPTASVQSVLARRVGVLGGGQLGRMMAEAAHRIGASLMVLDPLGEESPAGLVATTAARGSFKEEASIRAFAQGLDVLTVEIEHVNCDVLEALARETGIEVQPRPATIRLIQDKYNQKVHLHAAGVAVAPFLVVDSAEDAYRVGEAFGYPYMLKSRRNAYDGRGNAVVARAEDVGAAMKALGSEALYAEKWVPFTKELAVMVARSSTGEVRAYPVVETHQSDNICHSVLVPALISGAAREAAEQLACRAIETLDGAGIFGVELFLTADDAVLLNEIAPRPHNSGHYTMEACAVDQFEQHLRAVLGLPLGATELSVHAALMVNILGVGSNEETGCVIGRALATPGTRLHWYGKAEDKKGRKMGHFTITAPSLRELRRRAEAVGMAEAMHLFPQAGGREALPLVGIIMGSDSDLPTMKDAAALLDKFDVPYELTVVSAHRTPERMFEYAKRAADRGLKVIIAGAGGAAHLPGMVAALTPLPVIGVPVKTSTLSGVDSLYSIVQMPRGVPVATVAIGNAQNAGLLAARILAAYDPALLRQLLDFQLQSEAEVEDKAARLEELGYKEYLASAEIREVK
jgi:phosphoribosylaminoimidazole carboxylase